jgi:hypothetical protein
VLLVGCPSNPYEEPRCTSPEIDVVFKNFSLPSYELTFVRSGQTLERAMRDPSARVTCPGTGGPRPSDPDACYTGPNADFELTYDCRDEEFFVNGAVQVLIRIPDEAGASVEQLIEASKCPCDGYAELYVAELSVDTQMAPARKILQDGDSCSPDNKRTTLFEADSCR